MSNWNQRFAVAPSKDNPRLHDYYREYFDKPSGRKLVRALKPKHQKLLDPPNLRASLGFDFQRMPAETRAVSRRAKSREAVWNNRFTVMWSKDNPRFHTSNREYFDLPKEADFKDFNEYDTLPQIYRASTYRGLRSTMESKMASTAHTWHSSRPYKSNS
jgi:hypothetical protein